MTYKLQTARFLVLCSAMLTVACGCVLTSSAQSEEVPGKATPTPTDPDRGARVAIKWQEKLQEVLLSEKFVEAWGLFSAGGWSNSGQIFLFFDQGRKHGSVMLVPANKTSMDALSSQRDLTGAELGDLISALKSVSALEDVDDESFDSLEIELVHFLKNAAGKIQVEDRLYIRDSGNKPHPQHAQVITTIEKLKKAPR